MKKIGLIGGLSWESSQDYYRLINEGIRDKLGALHSAELIMYSVDFEPIEQLQHIGDWQGTADILINAAHSLENAGAECLLICSNTMHKVAPQINMVTQIPLLHIADSTAEKCLSLSYQKVGLLGTKFTMEQDFYKSLLQNEYNISVITPKEPDRELVHSVIYNELCMGKTIERSKSEYLRIIKELASEGAEAVILGCTEIGMLITQNDTDIPILNTTEIHAEKAVEFALG